MGHTKAHQPAMSPLSPPYSGVSWKPLDITQIDRMERNEQHDALMKKMMIQGLEKYRMDASALVCACFGHAKVENARTLGRFGSKYTSQELIRHFRAKIVVAHQQKENTTNLSITYVSILS